MGSGVLRGEFDPGDGKIVAEESGGVAPSTLQG